MTTRNILQSEAHRKSSMSLESFYLVTIISPSMFHNSSLPPSVYLINKHTDFSVHCLWDVQCEGHGMLCLVYLLFHFGPCLTYKCHWNHQDKLVGLPKGSHEGRWFCWTVLVLSFCFVFWHSQLGVAVDSLMHALLTYLNLIGSSIHNAFN